MVSTMAHVTAPWRCRRWGDGHRGPCPGRYQVRGDVQRPQRVRAPTASSTTTTARHSTASASTRRNPRYSTWRHYRDRRMHWHVYWCVHMYDLRRAYEVARQSATPRLPLLHILNCGLLEIFELGSKNGEPPVEREGRLEGCMPAVDEARPLCHNGDQL